MPVGLIGAESPRSLLERLARANHLPPTFLRQLLPVGQRPGAGGQPIDLSGLATLSGYPLERMKRALGGPRSLTEAMLACQRCAARAGTNRPVEVLRPLHAPLCRRHRRWLGGFYDDGWADGGGHIVDRSGWPLSPQLDLTDLPDVLAAQRRHVRLVHDRRSSSESLRETWADATHVVFRWTTLHYWPEHRTRRLGSVIDLHRCQISEYHPAMRMANYPEVVALAELLAHPNWQYEQAIHDWDLFAMQVERRLRIPYNPDFSREPLRALMVKRAIRTIYERDQPYQPYQRYVRLMESVRQHVR